MTIQEGVTTSQTLLTIQECVTTSQIHSAPLPCREGQGGESFQSLLVEGGAQTLQSFIDADLWDEAYIERSPLCLGGGVKAPQIQTDTKGRPVHVNFT